MYFCSKDRKVWLAEGHCIVEWESWVEVGWSWDPRVPFCPAVREVKWVYEVNFECAETTWMHVWSVNAALKSSADFSDLLPLTLDEAHAVTWCECCIWQKTCQLTTEWISVPNCSRLVVPSEWSKTFSVHFSPHSLQNIRFHHVCNKWKLWVR